MRKMISNLYSFAKYVIYILSASFFLGGCSIREIKPGPLLLIPGYGSKKNLWQESGVIDHMRKNNMKYGGHLSINKSDVMIKNPNTFRDADFFSISFTDSISSIELLAKELELLILKLKKSKRTGNFTLMAYSMGGVVKFEIRL